MKRYQNQLIIGVDTGNFNTKTQTACFTSGYSELAGSELKFEDMLEYEGRHFALSGNRRPVRDDKTVNEDFFLLTLFAIGKELVQHKISPGSYSVILSVGLPPGHLSVKNLKQQTQAYFKKQATFSYNKIRYENDVSRVIVCPQGYASLLADAFTDEMEALSTEDRLNGESRPIDLLAKEPLAILLDIGGGTVDPIVLKDGVPQPDVHISLSEGIITVYNEISAEIKAKSGRDVSESVISLVLDGKPARVDEADARYIRDRIQRYADNLLMRLTEQKLPFGSSYVLLMGGGSKVIRSCWEKSRDQFGKLDFIGDIRANAAGYEEMALRALMRG
jgi:plasmid segregation protein ParM